MQIFKWLFNRKYRFFSQKIKAVQYSLWDLEFKVAKSHQVREGVRQDRDRAVEGLANINKALEADPKNEKILADKATFEDNVKRYEAQMGMIDAQINGANGDETHEPVIGIMEQMKSYAELREMYKTHLTQI